MKLVFCISLVRLTNCVNECIDIYFSMIPMPLRYGFTDAKQHSHHLWAVYEFKIKQIVWRQAYERNQKKICSAARSSNPVESMMIWCWFQHKPFQFGAKAIEPKLKRKRKLYHHIHYFDFVIDPTTNSFSYFIFSVFCENCL